MQKKVILYYLALMLIMVSWTDDQNLPPFFMRMAFLVAVILPLWISRSFFFPVILYSFIVVSAYSYAVSYMPVDGLYILMAIISGKLFYSKNNYSLKPPISFFLLALWAIVVEFIYGGDYNMSFCWLSIGFSSWFFFNTYDQRLLNVIMYSFVSISLVLSLEFLFLGNEFISIVVTYIGEQDRKGWADPNYFGSVIGMGVVTAEIMLIIRRNIHIYEKIFMVSSIVLSIYTIITVASRGAVVAVAISSYVLLIIAPIKVKNKIRGVLLGGLLIVFMYYEHFLDLLILRFQSDAGDVGGRMYIWDARIWSFFETLSLPEQLIGIGKRNGLILGTTDALGFHNDFLAVLVRYGYIGLSLLILSLVVPILKSKNNGWVLLAALLYLLICMMTIEPFTGAQWGSLYYYIFILMLCQFKSRENVRY